MGFLLAAKPPHPQPEPIEPITFPEEVTRPPAALLVEFCAAALQNAAATARRSWGESGVEIRYGKWVAEPLPEVLD